MQIIQNRNGYKIYFDMKRIGDYLENCWLANISDMIGKKIN
jgi:hypothetical protein